MIEYNAVKLEKIMHEILKSDSCIQHIILIDRSGLPISSYSQFGKLDKFFLEQIAIAGQAMFQAGAIEGRRGED